MNRRSFFATIAAAFAAPAVPAIAKPAVVRAASLPPIPADAVVIHAFRLLGVVCPGELPPQCDMAEARGVLDQVLARWSSSGDGIALTASRIPSQHCLRVAHELAEELAPLYAVCRAPGYWRP